MTFTVADVKNWKPDSLEHVASVMRRRLQVVTHAGGDLERALPVEGWTGATADRCSAHHRRLVGNLDRHASPIALALKAVEQAADNIPPLQRDLDNLDALAQKHRFRIESNWSITDLMEGHALPPDMHPEDRSNAKQQLHGGLAAVHDTAQDISSDLLRVFEQAQRGDVPTGNGPPGHTVESAVAAGSHSMALTTPEPPKNGTPEQNAAWWATLSDEERAAAANDPVNRIGNLDGVPATARSTANKLALARTKKDFQQRLKRLRDELRHEGKDNPGGFQVRAGHNSRMAMLKAKISNLEQKINALNSIGNVLNKGGRQLVHLDPNKQLVEAAVANGNIDTAKNVAVFTPGFQTNISSGSLVGYDQNMDDLRRISGRITGSPGQTATVTWIGYQPPQADGRMAWPTTSVGSPYEAKEGGDSLAKFYNGVSAVHDSNHRPLHLTALGHSYGAVTTGYALNHKTHVDDAVLFGSPGQGASTLNVPEGHLYQEHAEHDYVPRLYGTLGPSPYYDSRVSGDYQGLSTDQSSHGSVSYGHEQYLKRGTTSLYNMAAVTTGHRDLAVHENK